MRGVTSNVEPMIRQLEALADREASEQAQQVIDEFCRKLPNPWKLAVYVGTPKSDPNVLEQMWREPTAEEAAACEEATRRSLKDMVALGAYELESTEFTPRTVTAEELVEELRQEPKPARISISGKTQGPSTT